MKNFPIYHEVESCTFKNNKSYKRKEQESDKFGSVIEFTFSFGNNIKTMLFKNENGKAGRYIKTMVSV